jgi:hypothetical protein
MHFESARLAQHQFARIFWISVGQDFPDSNEYDSLRQMGGSMKIEHTSGPKALSKVFMHLPVFLETAPQRRIGEHAHGSSNPTTH